MWKAAKDKDPEAALRAREVPAALGEQARGPVQSQLLPAPTGRAKGSTPVDLPARRGL